MHTKLYNTNVHLQNQSINTNNAKCIKSNQTIRSLLFKHHFTCVIKCYLPQ